MSSLGFGGAAGRVSGGADDLSRVRRSINQALSKPAATSTQATPVQQVPETLKVAAPVPDLSSAATLGDVIVAFNKLLRAKREAGQLEP